MILPVDCKMVYLSYFRVLFTAFLIGFAAAAPIGPVNMMAIRRGVAGGWRHSLACAIGAVLADMTLFSLALLGGHYLLPGLSNPKIQAILEAIGAIVLLPMGIHFVKLAVGDPRRSYRNAIRRWRGSIPAHLIVEAAKAFALTIFNPISIFYWAGVTSSWLPFAYSVLGPMAPAWGLLMVGAGLIAWFTALIIAVRSIPHRVGALFFRLANGTMGIIFLSCAMFCAIVLFKHFPH
ncbi:MAG: LysE family translocator [Terracidiphilus sp.]